MNSDKEQYGYDRHIVGAKSGLLAFLFVAGFIGLVASAIVLTLGAWYGWVILAASAMAVAIGAIPLSTRALGLWFALRYRVSFSHSDTAYGLYTSGLCDLMKSSPRVAVVSHRLGQLDYADFQENYDKNFPRYTPRRERIWGCFTSHYDPERASHPSVGMTEPLRFLDEQRVSWDEVERLVGFAFAVSKSVAGRDDVDAGAIGELTAAWYDSGTGIEEAVALLDEHGADMTKLLLQGVPFEYAVELTRPVDTKAW